MRQSLMRGITIFAIICYAVSRQSLYGRLQNSYEHTCIENKQ